MSGHGFHLYTSNNLRSLLGQYSRSRCRNISQFRRDRDVFTHERIAVATRGMGIWVEHGLTDMGHVMAQVEFPFLREAIDGILGDYVQRRGIDYQAELYDEQVMTWNLYRILGDILQENEQEYEVILSYFQHSRTSGEADVKRYHLAYKLASVYYDYLSFIPDKLHPELARNYAGERDNWQQRLWRRLTAGLETPASLMLRFLQDESLQDFSSEPLTFFGVSAMPPYFLKVLRKLATVTHVNVFYLNHCDEFWGDIRRRGGLGTGEEPEGLEEHFENTLLCQLGMQGRDFFNAIINLDHEIDDHSSWEGDEYPEVSGDGETVPLLRAIQERILSRSNPEEATALPSWDDSLTVHSCYTPLREVEALRDCLLKIMSQEHILRQQNKKRPRLTMNDIIVMAPDISQYAPYIRAVFDACPSLRGNYSISDRSVRHANMLADTFLQLLALGDSQFELSRIRQLMESPALRSRFGFDEASLEQIDVWLRRAAIRWGRDGESRRDDFGGRAEEAFSWRQGLDRLLLKWAFDVEDDNGERSQELVFGNMLSADIGTGSEQARILGALCRFYDELGALADELSSGELRTGSAWCELLRGKCEVFFRATAETALDYSLLRKAIDGLQKSLAAAGLASLPVAFAPLRAALTEALESPASGEPFLNGKITCCSMLPMRGIPCRVIALLGMDMGTFPRPDTSYAFNLIPSLQSLPQDSPERWLYAYTRQRGKEDRFTFLEALMSAQDYLLVFYHGRNEYTLQDDLLPAAPVSELMHYAARVREGNIEVKHTLNAFEAVAYAEDDAPVTADEDEDGWGEVPVCLEEHGGYTGALRENFSYDAALFPVASGKAFETQRIQYESMLPPPSLLWSDLWKLPLPQPLPFDNFISVDVHDLVNFLRDATGHFLRHRLGFPPDEFLEDKLADYEPFMEDDLAGARHCRRLFGQQLEANNLSEVELLPHEAFSDQAPSTPLKARLWALFREWVAKGELPIGDMGLLTFNHLQRIACWDIQQMRDAADTYSPRSKKSRQDYEQKIDQLENFKDEMRWQRRSHIRHALGYVDVQRTYNQLCNLLGLMPARGDIPSVWVAVTGNFQSYADDTCIGVVRSVCYSSKVMRYLSEAYVQDLLLLADADEGVFFRDERSVLMALDRKEMGRQPKSDKSGYVNVLGKRYELPLLTVSEAREQLNFLVSLYLVGQLMPVPLFLSDDKGKWSSSPTRSERKLYQAWVDQPAVPEEWQEVLATLRRSLSLFKA